MAIIENMPAEEYHRRALGECTKSGLDQVARSRSHYAAWVRGELDVEGDHFVMGTAFHCAVLEPERFAAEYIAVPDFGDCRFKEAKAARDAWREANAGKRPLKGEMWEALQRMSLTVTQRELARKLLSNGKPEVTVMWTDEATGLPCKSRADYWNESLSLIVDVKSTLDASPSAFRRDVMRYGYHRQDALYRAGFAANGKPIEHFVFVVVEKEPPFGVAFYTMHADAISQGYQSTRRCIDEVAEGMRTGEWPDYAQEILTIELPPWAA